VAISVGNRIGGCSTYDLERDIEEFVRRIESDGYAVVQDTSKRSWNHHVVGCGVGHDDARFAEWGESLASYLENECSEPWWADPTYRRWYVGE
jgi:hypothetical protein